MNLNKEDIEKMVKNNKEDDTPVPDSSYVYDDVKDLLNKIKLYNSKKLYKNLNFEEFLEKLKKDYAKLNTNFPSIFEKTLKGTIELPRLKFMLKMIDEVRNNKISKHSASVTVGQELVDNIVKPNL